MNDEIRKLPKIELHLHLDGSIPLEVAEKLSGSTKNEVIEKMTVSKNCHSLTEYLTKFDFAIDLLQTKANLKEVASSLANYLEKQNIIYAEIRFAPLFHTKKGLTFDEIIDAVLEGLHTNSHVKTNLILCMMRGQKIEDNLKVIEAATKYLHKGVCAIDLAGDESKYPTSDYQPLFEQAREYGIPFTIHAGETNGPDEVKTAVQMGASRIGHGIHIIENKETMEYIKQQDILLEICPTSNIQTNAVETYDKHPIHTLFKEHVKVCINTDNVTVSNISLSEEYMHLMETFHFTIEDIKKMNLFALEKAFLSEDEKEALRRELENH